MTVVSLVTAALATTPPVAPERVSHVYEQHLQAPPDRVLPLLTPLGERAWASGWEPDIRWEPPGGGAGTLFVTRHPGRPDTVWFLDAWEPAAGHVGYIRVTPGSDVTEIDIRLRPDGKDRTIATVRYTWTTLGEPGVALVRGKTKESYLHFMREWEQELNHYLVTGKKLPEGH
jgi:Polyketide cyclase / dehydrase and lipid transport